MDTGSVSALYAKVDSQSRVVFRIMGDQFVMIRDTVNGNPTLSNYVDLDKRQTTLFNACDDTYSKVIASFKLGSYYNCCNPLLACSEHVEQIVQLIDGFEFQHEEHSSCMIKHKSVFSEFAESLRRLNDAILE